MDNMNSTDIKYTHRFLARIVIEAQTPLSVGSGDKDLLTDSLVATDVNGLPYIPATSIAGVVRSMLNSRAAASVGMMDTNQIDNLFGFQNKGKENKGKGSEIIFTEAKVIDSTGNPVDGLNPVPLQKDALLKHYQLLPIRQHVRINGKGTAVDKGLFNEQVVYSGTRFCFEIEMVSDGSNIKELREVLRLLDAVDFRIGGGTRSGFGKIRVIDIKLMDLDLADEKDLEVYLSKTSALASSFWTINASRVSDTKFESKKDVSTMTHYQLQLTPESFFLFGSGFGDDEADMTPVKAKKVVWQETGEGKLLENLVLIPGSSLKGTLAHRVAFHWNRKQRIFSDDLVGEQLDKATGKHNAAVRILFGTEGEGPESVITRGNVIFSDIIGSQMTDKMLNHVSIDRFTGGALEGALFSEKASWGAGQHYNTDILIDETGLEKACEREWGKESVKEHAAAVKEALNDAITDLCNGMLPLGGGVNRGHGVFTGKCKTLTDKDHEGK